jgi:hypothetical protein
LAWLWLSLAADSALADCHLGAVTIFSVTAWRCSQLGAFFQGKMGQQVRGKIGQQVRGEIGQQVRGKIGQG